MVDGMEIIFFGNLFLLFFQAAAGIHFFNLIAFHANGVMVMPMGNFIIIYISNSIFKNDLILSEEAEFAKKSGAVRGNFFLFQMTQDITLRNQAAFLQENIDDGLFDFGNPPIARTDFLENSFFSHNL